MIRRCPLLFALAAAALLAACGPGVGGTGTGDTPGPSTALGPGDFGAAAAPVCASALADALACTSTGVPAGPDAAGTAAVRWDSVAPDAPLTARFEGNALQLDGACSGLAFRGSWGVDGAGDGRYYGSFSRDAAGGTQAGIVQVGIQPDASLQLRVLDEAGQVLAGPLRLERASAPDAPQRACP